MEYIIKNEMYNNLYIGEIGEKIFYEKKDNAKHFRSKEIALRIASLLTMTEHGKFTVIPMDEKGESHERN
ncbi:MAG: hypothetical protein ACFFDN_09210 [Candidatus Hodarchaeota archaeon]